MFPRISIVTPSFRSAAYIESTIQSVISQQYPNTEYIVIDGAGDETASILGKYEQHLAYWCSEPDKGQYDAINKGFARATGDILCWLNSDDMLLPRALFVVGEIFSQFPAIDWVSTLCPANWDANGYLCGFSRTPGFNKQAFLDGLFLPGVRSRGYWVQQESTFFRRSLWECIGAKLPDYSLAGDFALWCAFYRQADLVGIDYPLAGFRLVAGQRSEAMTQYQREARSALNAFRQEAGWVDSWKSRIPYSSFTRVPKLRTQMRHYAGYSGRKIVNRDLRQRGATWEMQEYRFLP